jgi:hypothetical protein
MSNWTKEWAGVYVSKTNGFEINKGASTDPNLWDLRQYGSRIGQYNTLAEAKRASGLR